MAHLKSQWIYSYSIYSDTHVYRQEFRKCQWETEEKIKLKKLIPHHRVDPTKGLGVSFLYIELQMIVDFNEIWLNCILSKIIEITTYIAWVRESQHVNKFPRTRSDSRTKLHSLRCITAEINLYAVFYRNHCYKNHNPQTSFQTLYSTENYSVSRAKHFKLFISGTEEKR